MTVGWSEMKEGPLQRRFLGKVALVTGATTAMVKEVARQGGRLDYVVSNAAINPFMTWDATPIEEFDNLFETNVRGAWVVCTEGARQMVAEGHGGAIVMTSSISAHVGAP